MTAPATWVVEDVEEARLAAWREEARRAHGAYERVAGEIAVAVTAIEYKRAVSAYPGAFERLQQARRMISALRIAMEAVR